MDRLVLHVGTMKSGTTFIQDQLFRHRDALAAQGVIVPGRSWADHDAATKDVLEHDNRDPGSWARLMQDADRPGTAVVSMEFFARVGAENARRVVEAVGVPVHVVVTARNINRQIPAMWQETIQNGHTWHWSEYLRGVEEFRPDRRDRVVSPAGQNFWRQQHLVRILQVWREAADALSLIPVATRGTDQSVWADLGRVAGFDPTGMEPGPRANASLGAASTQALRRANELFAAHDLPYPLGRDVRKRFLAKSVLAARRGEEDPVGLPVRPWVRRYARDQRRQIEAADVEVVGDLDLLTPTAVPGVDPEKVDPRAVSEAALHALVSVLAPLIHDDVGLGAFVRKRPPGP